MTKSQNQNPNYRNRQGFLEGGFTFVELMVVIAIIFIITGMVLVSYRRSQYLYQLNNSAEGIVSDLRRTESLSLSGKVPDVADPTDVRYGLATISEVDYLIFRDLDGDRIYVDGVDQIIDEMVLPADIAFSDLNTSDKLTVTFPHPGDKDPMTIYLNDADMGAAYILPIFSTRIIEGRQIRIERDSGIIKVE